LGFTICPRRSVQQELDEGSLTRLDWFGPELETSVIMIWHAEKWCSPLLRHFMFLCETVMAQG